MLRWPTACFILISLTGHPLMAQGLARDQFTVHTPDRVEARALPLALEASWMLRYQAGAERTEALVEMQRQDHARPALPTRDFVILTHGDHLLFDTKRPMSLRDNRLSLMPTADLGREPWSLYQPYVAMIVRQPPDREEMPWVWLRRLTDEPPTRDQVHLRNGDRIEGMVIAFDSDADIEVRDERDKRPLVSRVAWDRVAAVVFGADRRSQPRLRKAHGHVVLKNGGRVVCSALASDGDTSWSGRTWFGGSVRVQVDQVVNLSILSGPADYLADMKLSHNEPSPYLGVAWPIKLNRNVEGGGLLLGAETYDRGLGVHAPCRVEVAIDGKYQWFEATVGFDASAGRRARVKLAVELDGKRHDLGPTEWSNREPARAIRLDVRGAKKLCLVVERGSFGDVQARVDWGDARLIKKGPGSRAAD